MRVGSRWCRRDETTNLFPAIGDSPISRPSLVAEGGRARSPTGEPESWRHDNDTEVTRHLILGGRTRRPLVNSWRVQSTFQLTANLSPALCVVTTKRNHGRLAHPRIHFDSSKEECRMQASTNLRDQARGFTSNESHIYPRGGRSLPPQSRHLAE